LAIAGLAACVCGPGAARVDAAPVYGYVVENTYAHDPEAFTQGLIYADGVLYEGTGLYGESSLRKVELETGTVLKKHDLPAQYFGEGITAFQDTLFQLTWTNHVAFTYVEQDTFALLEEFPYPWDGWGLTHDGTHLIASDGSSTLRFLDPHTREMLSQIEVLDEGAPVSYLNELEYVQGKIYSNVLNQSRIAVIDPSSGSVEAWLDLTGLRDSLDVGRVPGAFNGIAFDEEEVRLFVTGKRWPSLFVIDVPTLNHRPIISAIFPTCPCTIEPDSALVLEVQAYDPDSTDTLEYVWSIDGRVDPSAHDPIYVYVRGSAGVETVEVEVSDGSLSALASWEIRVAVTGITPLDSTASTQDLLRLQSFPNPSCGSTSFAFTLPRETYASLRLYDVRGGLVRTLVAQTRPRGRHLAIWNGQDRWDCAAPAGVYFARLEAGGSAVTKRVVLTRGH
jgi:glutamine cyclotransferase